MVASVMPSGGSQDVEKDLGRLSSQIMPNIRN